MFDIGKINYMNGVYSGSNLNGAEIMIIDNETRADKVISMFKKKYVVGANPNEVLDNVFLHCYFDENDLTEDEVKYIEKELNAYVLRRY